MGDIFWEGADVRWIGRGREVDGVRLAPDDRAVVVDAGRHQLGSFATVTVGGREPPPRPHGILIRTGHGHVLDVRARDLELVAPDHPLRPEPDGRHADWWLEQLDPWSVGHPLPASFLIPRSLPTVIRVLHPWEERTGEPLRWSEAARRAGRDTLDELAWEAIAEQSTDARDHGFHEPDPGHLDPTTAAALADVLRGHTSTPDDVFVAIWVGWGDTPRQRFPGAAVLPTEKREHFLLRGPLDGVLESVSISPRDDTPASGIWWPADRAWLVATEIDFPWTLVGGSAELARALADHPGLETLSTRHDDPAGRLGR